MLLVVFDESRLETRRLAALNALTTGVSRASQDEALIQAALQDVTGLMNANAAWFRTINGQFLTLSQQVGLSADFLRARRAIPFDDAAERMRDTTRPVMVSQKAFMEPGLTTFKREDIEQIVVTCVPGRKALIGTLVLGNPTKRSYAPDELDFLVTCGQQLGLSLENVHLVEETLRSHRQWSNTFESIQDMVLLHDSSYRILKANPALLSRIGKSLADVVGQGCEAVLPKDKIEWSNCPYCHGEDEGFYEGPDPFVGHHSVTSTSRFEDQATKQKGTIHVIRDVTERRSAEQKYRALLDQLQEGVFVVSLDGKLLDCNDAFVRMLGYESREALLGCNVERELYASSELKSKLQAEVEARDFVGNVEVPLRRRDGSTLVALESSYAVRDQEGKVETYQSFLLDVTEKKRAEEEIARRNRELNALNAMAVIATETFDLDEILNLTLRQVISLMGAEAGSVYLAEADNQFRRRANWGQRVTDRKRFAEINFPDGFGDLVMRSRAEVLTADYLPHLPPSVTQFFRECNAGACIWVVLWGKDRPIGLMGIGRGQPSAYSSNDEGLLVAISRQLSTTIEKVRLYEETSKAYDDLRRAQEQLLQSEKMSAIGQLIAGVAHELNNPLTAILGYAQLLESETLDDKAKEYVGKIFKQGQRTHRVVQNLLSFARQSKPEKQQVNLLKVLDEALLLRDYDIKVGNIKIQRQVEADLPAVFGDPHQLEQVFLNIINNALDAMTVESEGRANGTEHRFAVRVSSRERTVSIEFQDSGPGIKEPSRIFEPFYTTKSVGKGTGLGLSICYGIIKEHGGEISARNAEGGGAIIEIKLPEAGRAAAEAPQTTPTSRRELLLKGKLLLVEDEESVLEFERDVLAGAGAQVTTALCLEQMKTTLAAESFDACILNGKMPGAGSVEEMHRWVVETYPSISAHLLFTFSSLSEPEIRSFLEQNEIRFLVKPFEIGDLITNARRLLAKARSATAAS
jgi:PAS domain S-box-containing protein